MARIRTVKPEFWTDEKVVECSIAARLLFIGLFNFANDKGCLERSPRRIKMQVFPADPMDCEPLIQELITHGLLTEYSVNDVQYLHISGFLKHQKINRPSKTNIPMPPGFNENSVSHHGQVTDGKEGKGKDLKDNPLSLSGAGEISPDGQGSPPTPWEDQDDENPCGKFPMSANWAPTIDFQRLAALWGRIIDGPAPGYTPQELASFQAYWKAEGRVFNQTQWEQKFADSVLYERQAAAKRKQHAGGSNATRYTAAAATAQQQVRAARNAERERQGLAPLGDDGGDLRQPLGDQKRGGTIHDLGPDDFEILR
ncbi:TPA: hypothetical protein NK775_000878 [Serratia marcescens]|nr:hypothetical protein [Serratia marcescens]